MNVRCILFLGPLPPPVHGFSEINRRMLARLQLSSLVQVFDVSPSDNGGLRLFKLFFKFVGSAANAKGGALYLPLSGGLRQLVDVCFAGISLLCGLRVFLHHHSFGYINHQPFYARLVLRLLRKSVHIVLCEQMGDLLCSQYSIPTENIRVISNAAFLNDANHPSRVADHKGKFVLGFLSNITAAKGCFDFIELVEAASANGLDVEGLMAGPVQAEIKEVFNQAIQNVACIKHVGAVYGEDKSQFFAEIDVLVFPTRYANEAEPVTIWEAMGAGVPVISLSRGCINGIVTNDAGWVIQNPDSFVEESLEKIRYLISNDVVLRAMKKAARAEFKTAKKRYSNHLDALVIEIARGSL